jgi:hypothetical protein
VVGTLLLQPWLTAPAIALMTAYVGAFLYASRRVPGDLMTRLEGTGLFVLSNFGFGIGFIEQLLKRTRPDEASADEELAEPVRSTSQ